MMLTNYDRNAQDWVPSRRFVQDADTVIRNKTVVREFLLRTVAGVFEVDLTLIMMPTRGTAAIAWARQVAMYLAHVGCGLSLTDVGQLFERDRTTVAHACHVVEEQREDEDFDLAVELLEQTVRLVNLPRYC